MIKNIKKLNILTLLKKNEINFNNLINNFCIYYYRIYNILQIIDIDYM